MEPEQYRCAFNGLKKMLIEEIIMEFDFHCQQCDVKSIDLIDAGIDVSFADGRDYQIDIKEISKTHAGILYVTTFDNNDDEEGSQSMDSLQPETLIDLLESIKELTKQHEPC